MNNDNRLSLVALSCEVQVKYGEVHFYVGEHPYNVCDNYNDTLLELKHGKTVIHTTQMVFLSGRWFAMGYRIFVHEALDDIYEIAIGCNNTRTKREIKIGHDLYKLWLSGEFDKEV